MHAFNLPGLTRRAISFILLASSASRCSLITLLPQDASRACKEMANAARTVTCRTAMAWQADVLSQAAQSVSHCECFAVERRLLLLRVNRLVM
jgi:hypothetical protein